jgi:acetyltransferase-like isoleucine patch superfamily enzyme
MLKSQLIAILKGLALPLLRYLKYAISNTSLLLQNPSLRISGRITYSNLSLGKYNFLAENTHLFNSSLGNYSYVSRNGYIENAVIGKFCCIGPNVQIGPGKHPVDFVSMHPVFYSLRTKNRGISYADRQYFNEYDNTIIDNDVWIGANVVILGGTHIGHGAVIASGAVVTKDVAPFSIVGGVPAKFIKKRFTDEEIRSILMSDWWNKDEDWYKKNYKDLHELKNSKI